MKAKSIHFPVRLFLLLAALLTADAALAGERSLTTAQVIELAKAKKVPLDHYLSPKASYDRKTDTWRVYYGSKIPVPGDFFVIRVHDKTKETRLLPGA
jgi:hypothetical protein